MSEREETKVTVNIRHLTKDIIEFLGKRYYTEEYAQEMMDREYGKGKKVGQNIHIAHIENITHREGSGSVTVWQFDDLLKDGYRFEEVISKRYCFISRNKAGGFKEARDYLIHHYEEIPKFNGTNRPLDTGGYAITSYCAVIIEK